MTIAIVPLRDNWLTALLWLLANTVGFGFAGAMFHNFPLAFTFPPDVSRLGGFRAEAAIVGFFFGFIPALLIGFLQHLILNRSLSPSRLWIIATSLGMGLMHFIADGFEHARDLSVAVFLGGLAVGVLQWRLLRSQAWTVWLILLNAFSWYVGWAVGIAILHNLGLLNRAWMPGLDGQTHGILGLSVGVVFGLSSGLLWVRQLRSSTKA